MTLKPWIGMAWRNSNEFSYGSQTGGLTEAARRGAAFPEAKQQSQQRAARDALAITKTPSSSRARPYGWFNRAGAQVEGFSVLPVRFGAHLRNVTALR